MRTFLDSSILLSAWDGTTAEGEAALAVIEDSDRSLLTSEIVMLELLPKPIFFKRTDEVQFYEEIFLRSQCDKVDSTLYFQAFDLAKNHGLAAADAFNLASAIRLKAEEFITLEKPSKPMFRIRNIRVISLYAASAE